MCISLKNEEKTGGFVQVIRDFFLKVVCVNHTETYKRYVSNIDVHLVEKMRKCLTAMCYLKFLAFRNEQLSVGR